MAVAISTNYELVPVTDYMRSYLAAAVCAVWLKLISWLSVINWQVINLVNLFYEVSDSPYQKIHRVCNTFNTDASSYLFCIEDRSGNSLDSFVSLDSHFR